MCNAGEQVGDTLKVVFRNSLPFSVNLVFDGGLIPENEALALAPVLPNKTVTVSYSVSFHGICAAWSKSSDVPKSARSQWC